MSAGMLFGKRTWIGFGVAVGVMLLSLLLGSLLTVRGLLPTDGVAPWLWVSYGLSVFIGGRMAAAGQGMQVCALAPAVLIYALAWLLALCSECVIDFSIHGVGITAAVVIGAAAAFISCGGKKKRKRAKKVKRPVPRPVRR